MKMVVVFNFKEGIPSDRAGKLALGIATMINASVRGEVDVTANTSPTFDDVLNALPLASFLEEKS